MLLFMCRIIIFFGITLLVVSCSLTSGLHAARASANLQQIRRGSSVPDKKESASAEASYRIESRGEEFYLVPVEREEGDSTLSMTIEPVSVISTVRSVAERNGEVSLDFRISLKKGFVNRVRSVTLRPFLLRKSGQEALNPINIRGDWYSTLQSREEWQSSLFRKRFSSTGGDFLLPLTREEGGPLRMERIVERREEIEYYYSLSVPVHDDERKLKIVVGGEGRAIDGSCYEIPMRDTLTYAISSMLSFIDYSPRYLKKIVEKYAHEEQRCHIDFPSGGHILDESFRDNRRELDRIRTTLEEVLRNDEFHLDTITITASCSPEGYYRENDRLSGKRSREVLSFLERSLPEPDTLPRMRTRNIAEDWEGVREWLQRNSIPEREDICRMIDSPVDRDILERNIRLRYPRVYSALRKKAYPPLRCVTIRYDLRRKGMEKDTIHTTLPDTFYMKGVEFLRLRKYPKACYHLSSYRDLNSVLAHLSMNHNAEALSILRELPESALREYLLAVVLGRLNSKTEGRQHLLTAFRLDPGLEFRSDMDPEIQELLKD